jgi:Flp pilus assembly protein TadD
VNSGQIGGLCVSGEGKKYVLQSTARTSGSHAQFIERADPANPSVREQGEPVAHLFGVALLFNQVLAADKRQFDALHMLGILQSRRRNYAEAVRLIARAIEVQPGSAQAHADLGRVQYEMGDAQAASERRAAAEPGEWP